MAKDKSKAANQSPKKNQPPPQGNVVAMPARCPVQECGKKAERSDFCGEHFLWFKEGLINRKGEKPKDFDKKYMAYQKRIDQAA